MAVYDNEFSKLFQVVPYPPESGNRWRMVRKMYAVRVEFEQAGSLGE